MINITIIGMDAVDSLLDRLIAAGEDERAERIERGAWDLETALSGLEEAIRNAAPEEADMESKKRWEPEEGETYFYVDSIYGGTCRAVWRNGKMDRYRERMNNVFQSPRDAYRYMEEVRADDR
jgi:hypothetical protein